MLSYVLVGLLIVTFFMPEINAVRVLGLRRIDGLHWGIIPRF